ncbi:MAG: hypothetical protein IIW17_08635 [Clostridia bacterium]|nr:hypothetical protein [Clostridia bacterium]
MKKNVFLKLASALLVLCLASTCAIGTTFAKYTTADRASDTARVAKWGITVAVSGTLFGSSYEDKTGGNDIMLGVSDSVEALNGTDTIVAPGTENKTGFQVSITGTPEVQYDVTAGLNGETISDIWLAKGTYAVMVVEYGVNENTDLSSLYVKDGATYKPATAYATGTVYYAAHDVVEVTEEKYYPVTWYVKIATGTPTPYTTLEAATTAMTNAFNGMGGNAKATINETYTLTWAWPFEEGADDAAKALRNAKDTILGNLAANASSVVKLDGGNYVALTGNEYSLTVNFGFNVTVEQVD